MCRYKTDKEVKMENATLEKRTESKTLDKTVERIALYGNPVELVNNMYGCHPVTESVRRIAKYDNPVELVNNMYGCHPDGNGSDYFSRIYGDL